MNYRQLLLIILLILLPTYLIRFHLAFIPTTLWELLLLAITIYAIGSGWLTWKVIRADPLRWPIFLIWLGGLIGLLVHPTLASLGQWRALLVEPFIFYWLIRGAVTTSAELAPLLMASLVSGALVGLQAIVDRAFHHIGLDGRVTGIYALDQQASPNYLALYLAPIAILGCVALAASFLDKKMKIGFIQTAFALCIIGGIVVSISRSGLLALAIGALVGFAGLLLQRYPLHRSLIVGLAVLILGIGLARSIPSFLPNFAASEAAGGRVTTSNNIRVDIWRTTVKEIIPAAGLFGLGWGTYQATFTQLTAHRVNFPEYIAPLALHPHNFWLMSLVTLGVLGTIGWFLLFLKLFERFRFRSPSTLSLIFLASLSGWLVQGLVDTTYYKNDLAPFLLFLVAAIEISVRKSGLGVNEKPSTSSR